MTSFPIMINREREFDCSCRCGDKRYRDGRGDGAVSGTWRLASCLAAETNNEDGQLNLKYSAKLADFPVISIGQTRPGKLPPGTPHAGINLATTRGLPADVA